jgi:hypothetical protein
MAQPSERLFGSILIKTRNPLGCVTFEGQYSTGIASGDHF